MVVSRFLKFPIQMNLSEKDFSHSKPFYRVSHPSGVGGYLMGGARSPRPPVGGNFRRHSAARPAIAGGIAGHCDPPGRPGRGPAAFAGRVGPYFGEIGG